MPTFDHRYHPGEIAVQRRAREREFAQELDPMIASAVGLRDRFFLQGQQMLVVASLAEGGQPLASVLFGRAGLITAGENGRRVTLDLRQLHDGVNEVSGLALGAGAPVGLLAIDLATRRRLRINGRVEATGSAGVEVRVEQAYPNCPKYIQRRLIRSIEPRGRCGSAVLERGAIPDGAVLQAVAAADTAFVASGNAYLGLDASHRGGPPGFIQVLAADRLSMPDYAGNSMFNTLGNLAAEPRCGLTILDFEQNVIHQLACTATPRFGPPDSVGDAASTGRTWELTVHSFRSLQLPVQVDWETLEASPYNPGRLTRV